MCSRGRFVFVRRLGGSAIMVVQLGLGTRYRLLEDNSHAVQSVGAAAARLSKAILQDARLIRDGYRKNSTG